MNQGGRLVLYKGPTVLWSTNTSTGQRAVMQGDGNMVLYTATNQAVWNTGTYGNAGARLVVQNDGNVVVYSSAWKPLWASNTVSP